MPLNKSGYTPETQTQTRTRIANLYRQLFGESVNILEENRPIANLYEIDVAQSILAEESRAKAWAGLNIDTAEGQQLDILANNVNIYRILNSSSTVVLRFFGEEGVIIPEGFRVSKPISPVVNFQTLSEVEIGSLGYIDVNAQSLETGTQTNLRVGQITSIVNPLVGLSSVENITPAVGGGGIESDDSFRDRIKNIASRIGNESNFFKRLFQIAGVNFVDILENILLTSTDIAPPLSVAFIVDGGLDSQIGRALVELGAIPFRTVGSIKYDYINTSGRIVSYFFSRPVSIEIEKITINIRKTVIEDLNDIFLADYKEQIANYINSDVKTGRTLRAPELITSVNKKSLQSFPSVWNSISDITISFTRLAITSDKISFAYNERPFINIDNIEIIESYL